MDLIELLKAALLGLVEGVTEFLPISSTAHLLIGARLLQFRQTVGGTFEIAVQLGAALAVIGYYASDLAAQARGVVHDPAIRRFWRNVAVAVLPATIVGFLLRNWIKTVLYGSPGVIAWALILGGVAFIVVERRGIRSASAHRLEGITLSQALAIGMFQALALVPGVSRSGASILGGMLARLDRETATRFSFYLAIPTLSGATLLDLLSSWRNLTAADLASLGVGMVVAFVVSWASIGWLLRYVARNTFIPFGWYRIAAGLVILALAAAGVL